MAIQVLDQSTINQIAAGEVVERPSSVVKELMENAIDAGATAITVEIKDGGIGFIRITDNGCGIAKEELPLAFLRHSTSKIQTAADLVTVSSLGFRGEALSSIAAVSQVELITKTPDSLSGSRYRIEGGVEKGLEEVGAPEGTTFISRNLFYNTPARRKFLKTPATEGGHVASLVEKIALSHPEISIRLIVNNQNRLHTSGNHNLKDIIYTVYGRETAAGLIPLAAETESVRITGFIGRPQLARSNRNFENYFINGRYIKSGLIMKAVEEGYRGYMMQHKYPFTMLHFTVEPEYIDVNVHPSKMELRFKNGEELYQCVLEAVTHALSSEELIVKSGFSEEKAGPSENTPSSGDGVKAPYREPEPFEKGRMAAMEIKEPAAPYPAGPPKWLDGGEDAPNAAKKAAGERSTPGRQQEAGKAPDTGVPEYPGEAAGQEGATQPDISPGPSDNAGSPEQLEMFDDRFLSRKARHRLRLIGQVFDTYWLVEYQDTLYLIDQHAAHEKVLFERNFASLKSREYTSQLISPPIILTLSMQEEEVLNRHMEVFRQIGFEIEPFGGKEYAVRAVPDNLLSLAKRELLLEILDGLSEGGEGQTPETVYDRIASMSCKAAVKGNMRLSDREAEELLDELFSLENPYTCPHGRPTIISISKQEMEKKFKRIVT